MLFTDRGIILERPPGEVIGDPKEGTRQSEPSLNPCKSWYCLGVAGRCAPCHLQHAMKGCRHRGAGLSGMIAAREVLVRAGTPLVVEADDRVGGRILTEQSAPGVPIELGAQWIGDTHQRMFRLAAELGIKMFRQYEQGETTYELAGSGVLRENDFHARFAEELAGVERVLDQLDELAAEVPLDAPWTAPRAAEWDAITAGAWLADQGLSPVPAPAGDLHRRDPRGADGRGVVPGPALQPADLRGGRGAVRRVRGRGPDHPVRRRHQPDPARLAARSPSTSS